MEDNAHKAPFTQDHPKPKEKLAAYLMGRWRNGNLQFRSSQIIHLIHSALTNIQGTPVDESPHDDSNTALHKSNNFDYQPVHKHDKCPFAAHTRKMRPRGDLEDDHAVIIRRGISYGGEVTPEEWASQKSDPDHERGLLFVCYQSDIRNGFNFLTTRKSSYTSPTQISVC